MLLSYRYRIFISIDIIVFSLFLSFPKVMQPKQRFAFPQADTTIDALTAGAVPLVRMFLKYVLQFYFKMFHCLNIATHFKMPYLFNIVVKLYRFILTIYAKLNTFSTK